MIDKNKMIENISVGVFCVLVFSSRFYTVKPVVILNEANFFIISTSIGVLLGGVWIYVFFRINPGYFIKEKKRVASIVFQLLSIVVLTIFLIGFYNYQTGKKNIFHQRSMILSEWFYRRTNAGYFKMKIMDNIEKVDVSTTVYESFHIGDTVDLSIGRGGNGYLIIYKFDRP